jgi:tetratricopeptide (TPR) repeat protein
MPKAKSYAVKALSLDPELSDPQFVLGIIALMYEWDWDRAEKYLVQAQFAKPYALEIFGCTAHLLHGIGRTNDAELTLKQALQADPVSPVLNTELGCTSYYARQYDQSVANFRAALKLDPRSVIGHNGLARAFGQIGRYDEAYEALNQVQKASAFTPPIIFGEKGYVLGRSGKRTEALSVVKQLAEMRKKIYVDPYFTAIIYLGLGDKDEAFAWLNKTYQVRSSFITSIISEPKWEHVRGDPRFEEILTRIGLHEKSASDKKDNKGQG